MSNFAYIFREYYMMRYVFLCLCSLFCQIIAAQNESQTEYNFLRLPVSAHVAAMGGENVTMPDDDVTMALHNPAMLIGVTPGTLGLQYMKYMAGCNNASVIYNKVFSDKWHIAGSVQYLSYGSMRHTDADNNDLGTFSANDIAFGATLGYELTQNLAGGIRLKYVYGNIAGYTSMAVAADLGLNLYLPESEWSFGIVLKNLGGQIKAYDETFEKMPFDVQLGISKRLVGSPLRLSLTIVDINHPSYKFWNHAVAGAELLLTDQIYVALGYNFRRAAEMQTYDDENLGSSHGAGLSFGGGLNFSNFKLNLAYAKYHVSSSSIIANISLNL